MKKINGNKTVFVLIEEHPELKNILVNLGLSLIHI